jgi:hypothetical protein
MFTPQCTREACKPAPIRIQTPVRTVTLTPPFSGILTSTLHDVACLRVAVATAPLHSPAAHRSETLIVKARAHNAPRATTTVAGNAVEFHHTHC